MAALATLKQHARLDQYLTRPPVPLQAPSMYAIQHQPGKTVCNDCTCCFSAVAFPPEFPADPIAKLCAMPIGRNVQQADRAYQCARCLEDDCENHERP